MTDAVRAPASCPDGLPPGAGPRWAPQAFGGAWVLGDPAQVEAALRDPRLSVARVAGWGRLAALGDGEAEARPGRRARGGAAARRFQGLLARALLFRDGEAHHGLRRLMLAGFTPAALAALRPKVAARCAAGLAALRAQPGADFIEGLARPLPAAVIADWLGLPEAQRPALTQQAGDLARLLDAMAPSPARVARARAALLALAEALAPELQARRAARAAALDGPPAPLAGPAGTRAAADADDAATAHTTAVAAATAHVPAHAAATAPAHAVATSPTPADAAGPAPAAAAGPAPAAADGLDRLLAAEAAGLLPEADDALAQLLMLLFAGHETTRHLLGSLVAALVARPWLWARLRADPAARPAAVREVLRLWPPVRHTVRRVGQGLDWGGQRLRRGELLVLDLAAANRDPARFPDPQAFRLDRPPRASLAFGHGPHVCLGAALSLMEAELLLDALLAGPTLPRPAGPPAWIDSPLYTGLERLPLDWA